MADNCDLGTGSGGQLFALGEFKDAGAIGSVCLSSRARRHASQRQPSDRAGIAPFVNSAHHRVGPGSHAMGILHMAHKVFMVSIFA